MDQGQTDQTAKDCFGDLERVFPLAQGQMRAVPEECWDCPVRVECLKRATQAPEGKSALQQELAAREEDALGGVGGFLKRWSRLKSQRRKDA